MVHVPPGVSGLVHAVLKKTGSALIWEIRLNKGHLKNKNSDPTSSPFIVLIYEISSSHREYVIFGKSHVLILHSFLVVFLQSIYHNYTLHLQA